jgi:hypothetical protein
MSVPRVVDAAAAARCRLALLLAALLVQAPSARAAASLLDRAFATDVVALLSVDALERRCVDAGGADAQVRGLHAAWSRDPGTTRLRAAVEALGRDAAESARLAQARRTVDDGLDAVPRAQACAALGRLLALPSTRFRVPDAPAMPPAAAASTAPAGTGPSAQTAPQAAAIDRAAIARFGFHSRTRMGVGGFLTVHVFPVVLFRDGRALLEIRGLSPGARTDPGDWTRWREQGARVQVLQRGEWTDLQFQRTYPGLPAGFVLEGRFRQLAGTGNVATGGGDSVATWREFEFARDGRVTRRGGAGASVAAGGASVVTSAKSGARTGRWRIDGLDLHLAWDDGGHDTLLLVTDPADPKSALWLDGEGYVRR